MQMRRSGERGSANLKFLIVMAILAVLYSGAYALLGVRLECAQCHKHPFDQWTQQDFNGFQAGKRTLTTGKDRSPKSKWQFSG